MEDKQKLIDSLAYPPTHTYILDGLRPTGVLAQRLSVINRLAPDFFTKKERFLDVGCNKGFFSLYGAQFFDEVVGIDNTPEFIELCTKIKAPNTEFLPTNFRDFTPIKRFDRILLGNVHHYIYRTCQGSWDWLYKLAAISKGLVIIEGPIDMTCPDMLQVLTEDKREHFNYEEFIKIMNRFFTLRVKIPTVGYTTKRYVMVFERKPDWAENIHELNDLPVIETIKANEYTRTFETANDLICKTMVLFEEDGFSRVNIARMSPVSNQIVGAVHNEGRWVGWLEKKLKGTYLKPCENEVTAFREYCLHQIFLAKNGYIDFDVTMTNFLLENDSRKLVWFDKNQVRAISKLTPATYALEDGWYFKYMKNGFRQIFQNKEILELISNAMATKNSIEIENTFRNVSEILNGGRYNREGVDMLNEGNIDGARKAFLRAVEQSPDCAVAYNNLGLLSYHQGQYNDAIKYFGHALKIESSNQVIIDNIVKASEVFGTVG